MSIPNLCLFISYAICTMKSITDTQTGEIQLCYLEEQLSVYCTMKSKTFHTVRTVPKSTLGTGDCSQGSSPDLLSAFPYGGGQGVSSPWGFVWLQNRKPDSGSQWVKYLKRATLPACYIPLMSIQNKNMLIAQSLQCLYIVECVIFLYRAEILIDGVKLVSVNEFKSTEQ